MLHQAQRRAPSPGSTRGNRISVSLCASPRYWPRAWGWKTPWRCSVLAWYVRPRDSPWPFWDL